MTAKNIIAYIMAICVCFGGMKIYAYEYDEIPGFVEAGEIIYDNDGNDNGLNGVYTITDNGKVNSGIEVGNRNSFAQLLVKFENNLNDDTKYFKHGRMLIEFDVCATRTDHAIVFGLDDDNKSQALFAMNQNGKMYYNMSKNWPNATYLPECAKDYAVGKWYNIKILADTFNRRLIYYLDNKFWGEYKIENGKYLNPKVYPKLKVKQLLFNYHPDWNMSIGENKGRGSFIIDNLKYSIPEFETAELICETPSIGNILNGDTKILKYYLINEGENPSDFVLEYDIRSSDNKSSQKGKQAVTVSGGSEREITVSVNAGEYGFYTAYAKLKTENGSVVDRCETRFSIIADNSVKNDKIGFSASPMTHNKGTYEETVAVTKSLGGGLYREDFPWSLMYALDGTTVSGDWSWLKEYPTVITESGGEILALLAPGNDSIAGVQWPITEYNIKNTDALDKWSNYCTRLATLLNDKCNNYEVYNEWAGQAQNKTKATPKAYAELLKCSAEAIRKGNEDAKITAFCCFYTDAEWLDKAISALGDNPGQYFDAISIHPYMTYWSNLEYPEEAFISGMKDIKDVLTKYGLQDKPIYATEYGFSTGYTIEDDYGNLSYPINENLKAAYNSRMLIMGGEYFDKTYLYTLCDKSDAGVDADRAAQYEAGLGFTAKACGDEIPYEAYPSAVALAGYNRLMNGAMFSESRIIKKNNSVSDYDIYMYKFNLSDGREAIAMWGLNGDETISADLGADLVTVYDMYANPKNIDAYNGCLTFNISESPIYIVAENLSALTDVILNDDPLFLSDSSAETSINGDFILSAKTPLSDFTVSIEKSVNTYADPVQAVNGIATIKVTVGDNQSSNDKYNFADLKDTERIALLIGNGTKTYFNEDVYITYAENEGTDIVVKKELFDYTLSNTEWHRIMQSGTKYEPFNIEKEKDNGKLYFKVLY